MSWLDTFKEIRSTDWSQVPEPDRDKKAREVVTITAYASAAAAVVPVPFVDLALLLPFHSAMVMTVGHVLGRNISEAEAKRVALELGAVAGVTLAARAGLTALKKIVMPGIGGVLAAPASFAATWALGRVTITYFHNPELSREELKRVFKDAFSEAGEHFSKETLDRFRKGDVEGEGEGSERQGEAPEADNAAPEDDAPKAGAPLSSFAEDEPAVTPSTARAPASDVDEDDAVRRPEGVKPPKRSL